MGRRAAIVTVRYVSIESNPVPHNSWLCDTNVHSSSHLTDKLKKNTKVEWWGCVSEWGKTLPNMMRSRQKQTDGMTVILHISGGETKWSRMVRISCSACGTSHNNPVSMMYYQC